MFMEGARAVTDSQKVEKTILRCKIDRLAEGYKGAIDEIRGPIAKTGGKSEFLRLEIKHFLVKTMF